MMMQRRNRWCMQTTESVRCLLFLHKALLDLTIPVSLSIVLLCQSAKLRTSDAQIRDLLFLLFTFRSSVYCICSTVYEQCILLQYYCILITEMIISLMKIHKDTMQSQACHSSGGPRNYWGTTLQKASQHCISSKISITIQIDGMSISINTVIIATIRDQ